jgi:hypothetical protein
MANILTAAEAATILRCDNTDANMLLLLPQVDAYIRNATGRDWAADSPISPAAKMAARILLVLWHEDPGMMAGQNTLSAGLTACLTQLEAYGLQLETSGIADDTLELVASNPSDGDAATAAAIRPLLVFNHPMDTTATSAVTLQTAAGVAVSATNALDVTKKRLTITPAGALASRTAYQIVIAGAADSYGQTLTTTVTFTTM